MRSGGEYFIERGEFGKPTANQTRGRRGRSTARRVVDGQDDGRRHAGRAGRVHQAPVADGLRSLGDNLALELTDAVVCARLHAEAHGRRRTASARATRTPRRARPTASTGPGRCADGDDDFFGLDYRRRRSACARGATAGASAWASRARWQASTQLPLLVPSGWTRVRRKLARPPFFGTTWRFLVSYWTLVRSRAPTPASVALRGAVWPLPQVDLCSNKLCAAREHHFGNIAKLSH